MLNNYVAEWAALAAATCWAFTGVLSASSARYFGPMAFNRYRIVFAALLLLGLTSWSGGWHTLPAGSSLTLMLSGVVGIFVGDTALMMALVRLGPHRTAILFATNAPMAAALGFWLLQETLSLRVLLGCGTVLAGVVVAILLGSHQDDRHYQQFFGYRCTDGSAGSSEPVCWYFNGQASAASWRRSHCSIDGQGYLCSTVPNITTQLQFSLGMGP
jgi:uncharacterized membrane protein